MHYLKRRRFDMKEPVLKLCVPPPQQSWSEAQLTAIAPCLEKITAQERVQWALDYLPGEAILTSSFGAQSAVMLHLLTRFRPDIPVVLIDTGYLFPETYEFIDELRKRLSLNLKTFRSNLSPAWQEVRFGQLWEQGVEGIERYNQLNKVEPMARALQSLDAGTWFSGLRRSQSGSRRDTQIVQAHNNGVIKIHPLADWSDRDIHRYLKKHDLPYHPLWAKGFVSIGDVHTSKALSEVDRDEETRFFGLVRECGLHEPERFATPVTDGSS
jgi:phosphoadenosine phosphosulfate reductase